MSPAYEHHDRLVCRCLKIFESDILEAADDQEFRNLDEVIVRTGAGDGCMGCHRRLQCYVNGNRS